ncbi:MAG: histidine kinase [Firmicutes bacterium]|nr:histidine kinase [Bacillota bacterium]
MAGNERELALERVRQLEAQIDDLKKRWPAHSLKPPMMLELERLEEELEEARAKVPPAS